MFAIYPLDRPEKLQTLHDRTFRPSPLTATVDSVGVQHFNNVPVIRCIMQLVMMHGVCNRCGAASDLATDLVMPDRLQSVH